MPLRIVPGGLALVVSVGLAVATPRSLEPLMCDPFALGASRQPVPRCLDDYVPSPVAVGRVYLISSQSGRLEAAYSRQLVARVERKLKRSERVLLTRTPVVDADPAPPAPEAERWLDAPRWPWLAALGTLLVAALGAFGYAARRILLSPHPLLRNYSRREDLGLGTFFAQAASRRFWSSAMRSVLFWVRRDSIKAASDQPFSGLRRKSSQSTVSASAARPASSRTAAREWRAG